jgi:hypothetical protein
VPPSLGVNVMRPDRFIMYQTNIGEHAISPDSTHLLDGHSLVVVLTTTLDNTFTRIRIKFLIEVSYTLMSESRGDFYPGTVLR